MAKAPVDVEKAKRLLSWLPEERWKTHHKLVFDMFSSVGWKKPYWARFR